MKLYMISYTLRDGHGLEHYIDFLRKIKSVGPWQHPTENTWLVLSDMSADELYRELMVQGLFVGLIVSEVVPGSTTGYMSKDAALWIDALSKGMTA
jgi:hypothetical protein